MLEEHAMFVGNKDGQGCGDHRSRPRPGNFFFGGPRASPPLSSFELRQQPAPTSKSGARNYSALAAPIQKGSPGPEDRGKAFCNLDPATARPTPGSAIRLTRQKDRRGAFPDFTRWSR